jgi:hypothetical protein
MKDKTALQESSQALFCSIADQLGTIESNKVLDIKKFNTYEDFKLKYNKIISSAHSRISTPAVSLKEIDDFLSKNKPWYISSVNIAVALVNQISFIDNDFKIKAPGYQNIFYFRGDSEIMGTISSIFKIANKAPITIKNQLKFGDINKWNPADIYFASDKAKSELKKELNKAESNQSSYNFINLNSITNSLIDSGDLLPLSLKLAPGTVKIERINFDKKKELEAIEDIKIVSVNDWKPYKIVKYPAKGETRDITVNLSNGGKIKMRHDPSTPSYKIEAVIDKASRGGSIGSMKMFCELMSFVDKSTSEKLLKAFNIAEQEFKKEIIILKNKKYEYDIFDYKRAQLSAMTITNAVNPILKNWYNQKNEKTTQFCKLVYLYTTARTQLSGKFVLAK